MNDLYINTLPDGQNKGVASAVTVQAPVDVDDIEWSDGDWIEATASLLDQHQEPSRAVLVVDKWLPMKSSLRMYAFLCGKYGIDKVEVMVGNGFWVNCRWYADWPTKHPA